VAVLSVLGAVHVHAGTEPSVIGITNLIRGTVVAPPVQDTVTCTKPSCQIIGQALACSGGTAIYSATPASGVSYASSIDPAAAGSIETGQGTSSIDVTWSSSGIVTLHVCDLADTACCSSCLDTVMVTKSPICIISGPSTPCIGLSLNYTAFPTSGVSYVWS